MKVLVAFRRGPHSHDYLIQHLYAGFKNLLGDHNVLDYPENPFCHLPESRPGSRMPAVNSRDECGLDSDHAYPAVDVDGPFDLIIGGPHAPAETNEAMRLNPNAKVAWVDGSDNAVQHPGPGVQFKRELRIGQTWAHPCPMTYPLHRIPYESVERTGVVYYASTHGGSAGDRMTIAESLRRIPGARVHTTVDQQNRPTPEQHHEALWSALVGVHWNPVTGLPVADGASGYDSNRLWENLAFGVAVVALRPFIEIPFPFTDGHDIIFVDSAAEVGRKVEELLDDPARARRIGAAGHLHFLRYHCAEARARYIMERCGIPW